MSSSPALSPPAAGDALGRAGPARGRPHRLERGSMATRLITIAVLVAALVSLLLEVPALQTVASDVGHVSGGWLILAIAFELAAEITRLGTELTDADAELSELLRNSGDGAGDDQADSGSSALEREQELTLVNNTRDLLAQNIHALARIDDGTFGTCELCGAPISKARLQAFPRAILCVQCKQRQERR